MSPQIWFVTGASHGIGLSVTEYALAKGDVVIAAVRTPELMSKHQTRYSADRLLVVKVNVRNQDDVDAAFAKAEDTFGRIDVVYNNAGYSAVGEVEAVPMTDGKDLFETNFFGAVRVSLASIKFFREVNKPMGGRLIQASSIFGLTPGCALGYYTASKYALEGITDVMASELDPAWNIKISLAEMGFFRTNMIINHTYEVYEHPAYANPQLLGSVARAFLGKVDPATIKGDPDKLAKRIYELANLVDPPRRILLGKDAPSLIKAKFDADIEERGKYSSWAYGLDFHE